jgi:O-antigen/teichoic acid export membrane protein
VRLAGQPFRNPPFSDKTIGIDIERFVGTTNCNNSILKRASRLTSISIKSESLRVRAFRAGAWLVIAHGGGQLVRLAGNLIMTRLLAPELFGIIAVASAIQIITALLSDIGLSQAVIQSPRGDDKHFLNTAWTLQFLRGGIIFAACAAIAAGLHFATASGVITGTSVYADRRLPMVIAVASLSAVILGLQSMKATLHSRDLNVRPLTYIELASQISTLSVSAITAYLTHSVWAFVAGGLASSAVTTLLSHLWLVGPKDRFGWNAEALGDLRHFGKWAFLSSIALAFSMNGDRLLLGLWLTPAILGYYSIAAGLATMVEGIGNRLFSNLSFPALSEVARKDPVRFSQLYFRMRWISDAGFVWTAGFLFAAADLIVAILYDKRYASAGFMLQLLSLSLIFNRYNLAGYVYLAAGRLSYASALNWIKMISLFCLVPTLYYFFGTNGAILGIAIHRAPTMIFIYIFDRRLRLLNMPLEFAALGFWLAGWGSGKLFVTICAYVHAMV